MAIAFSYNPATEVIESIGGTAETPETGAGLYAWDLANSLILMEATAPAVTLSLDYPIQTAEMGGLRLTFTLVGCVLEVTDTIYILGYDSEGNILTEFITIDSGNGDYTSLGSYKSIVTIACIGFSVDGTVALSQSRQGIIGKIGTDNEYPAWRIYKKINFGDDSTASYFTSEGEIIYFDSAYSIALANTTLNIVQSMWVLKGDSFGNNIYFLSGAALIATDTTLAFRGTNTVFFERGTAVLTNCVLVASEDVATMQLIVFPSMTSFKYTNITLVGIELDLRKNPTSDSNGIKLIDNGHIDVAANAMISGIENISGQDPNVEANSSSTVIIRDSVVTVTDAKAGSSAQLTQDNTFNLKVVDSNGDGIEDVTVQHYHWTGSWVLVWTEDTDASGNLDSTKYIKYSKWDNQDGAPSTTYYPHYFVFTKDGYVTYQTPPLTIDKVMTNEMRIEMPLLASGLVSACDSAITDNTLIGNLEEIVLESASMQYTLDVLLRTILDGSMMIATTIATVTSQTSFTLSAGSRH